MTETPSTPDSLEFMLAQFVTDYQAATDPAAVLADFERRHPQWALDLQQQAALIGALNSSRPTDEIDVPNPLGDFRLIRFLARGGMGEIYLAEQLSLKRRVVVKVIRKGRNTPQAQQRFLREREVLARLHQTNIAPIHAAGEQDGLQYFVMPYISGAVLSHVVRAAQQHETEQPGSAPTLDRLAEEVARRDRNSLKSTTSSAPAAAAAAGSEARGWQASQLTASGERSAIPPDVARDRLPPSPTFRPRLSEGYFLSVARFLANCAEALHHAHQSRSTPVVHGDLKPSNLMIEENGHGWVIDWGLAQNLDEAHGETSGTPGYMAPEQWRGEKLDARTDVWSLGVTLYELLTLQPAFQSDKKLSHEVQADLYEKTCTEEPPRPRHLIRNIPYDLEAICAKALRKDPKDRYASAADFAADLGRWLNWEPITALRAHALRRIGLWCKRNKAWATAIVLLALLALAGTGIALENARAAVQVARADTAEARLEAAAQQARDRQREALILALQGQRLTTHTHRDWFDALWPKVQAIARLRAGDDLRDQAAATLLGLDVRTSKLFTFSAKSLAFDPKGERLYLGGLIDQDRQPLKGIRVWDRTKEQTDSLEQEPSDGLFGFAADGSARQLIFDKNDALTLLLWDVEKKQVLQRFTVTGSKTAEVVERTLTRDARTVAALVGTKQDKSKGNLFVYEAASGKLLLEAPSRQGRLELSPDGRWLAVGDEDGVTTVRKLPEGEIYATLRSDRVAITSLAFGPDRLRRYKAQTDGPGWLLAAGDTGGGITVWDLHTKVPRSYCRGSHYDVHAVACSPDGVTLASAGRGPTRLWDIATGQLLLRLQYRYHVTALAFSPDGKSLATNHLDPHLGETEVEVLNLENGRGIRTLRGLVAPVAQVHFSPDGKLLAALAHNWQVAIYEQKSGRLLHILETPRGFFADNAGLALNADGIRFALATGEEAALWDLKTGKVKRTWSLPPGLVDQLAFHPSGRLLLFREETKDRKQPPMGDPAKAPRVCRIRDLSPPGEPRQLAEIPVFNWHVYGGVSTPDGSVFIAEGQHAAKDSKRQRMVKAFDGLTGQEKWSLASVSQRSYSNLAMDSVGRSVAVCLNLEQAPPVSTRMDVSSGKELGKLAGTSGVISSDATYHGGGQDFRPGFSLLRRDDQTKLVTLGLEALVTSVVSQFHPDGHWLAWGNEDGTVFVCDIPEVQRRLAGLRLGWE